MNTVETTVFYLVEARKMVQFKCRNPRADANGRGRDTRPLEGPMPWDDTATRRWRLAARERNKAFVESVNSRTFCAHCGAQPVEWHNPEHVELKRQKFRIGDMAARGQSIKAIEEEMARCTPLCRRCHMLEDGRMRELHISRRRRPENPPQICSECGDLKRHYARGLCSRCYQRQPDQLVAKNRPRPYHGDLTATHFCGASEWAVTKAGRRRCRPCQRKATKASTEKRKAAAREHVAAHEVRQLSMGEVA